MIGRSHDPERKELDVVERFSAAQAARLRARHVDGALRALLCTAVRTRVRNDDWERATPRAFVVDRRCSGDGGED